MNSPYELNKLNKKKEFIREVNMSRFSFDDYDDDDDEFEKEGEKEDLIDELFLKDQIIAVQQENNELLLMEIDQKILENAIMFCKSSWFWISELLLTR